MAFSIGGVYGLGNWGGLPELGLTEKLPFSNKSSLKQANYNTVGAVGSYVGPKIQNYLSNGVTPTTQKKTTTDTGGGSGTKITIDTGKDSGGNDGGDNDIQKEIDSQYNSALGTLNNRANSLNQAFQSSVLPSINAQFDSQLPLYQQARDLGVNALNQQKTEAGRQNTDILNSARTLYNELGQRNQNLFSNGALSSVGQASSEILGREAQKNFGNIRQNFADTLNTIQTKAQEVEQNYQVQLQSLESKRQSAIAQAQLELRSRLDEIESQKGELGQWKSQAKIETIKEYRNRMWSIQDEVRNYQNQIEMMKASQTQDLSALWEKLQSGVDTSVEAGGTALNTGVNNAITNANDFSSSVSQGETGYNPYSYLTGSRKKTTEPANILDSAQNAYSMMG